jgi:septum formation protein
MHLLKPLILASKSPRRISLLRQIGIQPTVIAADVGEDFRSDETPVENAIRLSLKKARAIESNVQEGIIIGADTIVVLDGRLLGKPENETDAHRMLRLLSGKTHSVITAFALVDMPTRRWTADYEETRVTFRELPDEEIAEYIRGGSPMDKAGAYGIQDDYGAVFVTRIEGCFYNVVGFPLAKFYAVLQRFQTQLNHQTQ